MPRRMSNTATTGGLRELLITDRERSLQRWPPPPGKPDEFLDDLLAHVPVPVSSSQLLQALMHAGLPHSQFAYAGGEHGKTFVLDERDQLTELAT